MGYIFEENITWDTGHPIETAQKMLKRNQELLDKAEEDLKVTITEVKRRQNRIAKLQAEIEKNLAVLAGRLA